MSVEVVAEVGSNWNGRAADAETLIRTASGCGADTIKFQHYPSERYGPHVMTRDHLTTFNEWAEDEGLEFLCSIFDFRTLREYVEELSPTRVKIASPELTHHELLRACASYDLHVILSTGMSTYDEVAAAVDVLFSADASVTLLQCVSSYPAPPEEMNMQAMVSLGLWTPRNYGLSDHTAWPSTAPVMATALGATMVEKHFTLNRFQPGPDHSYACDPPAFTEMVRSIRLAELMLGDGDKRVMPSEDPTDRRTAEWR